MKRETAKRLLDARTACSEIEYFTTGQTRDTIRTDRGLQLILQTLVANIGEALNRISQTDSETAKAIPDLRSIVGMRNQIVHGYDSVDYFVVWKVATEDIPLLAVVLDDLLEEAPPVQSFE
jgi:uncharacterized protein with HEPN domain